MQAHNLDESKILNWKSMNRVALNESKSWLGFKWFYLAFFACSFFKIFLFSNNSIVIEFENSFSGIVHHCIFSLVAIS